MADRDVIRAAIRAEWGLAEGELSTEATVLSERITAALAEARDARRTGPMLSAADLAEIGRRYATPDGRGYVNRLLAHIDAQAAALEAWRVAARTVPGPALTWRTGRKVGRTVYRQRGPEPSDDDPLIGVMDTPELAARVVEAVNGLEALRVEVRRFFDTYEPGTTPPWQPRFPLLAALLNEPQEP